MLNFSVLQRTLDTFAKIDIKDSSSIAVKFSYSGINLLYLKNHKNEQNIITPHTAVIMRTHLNAFGSSNNGTSKFIPNIPATTPKMATTNVAVVSNNSNCISWFRTLSCRKRCKWFSWLLMLYFRANKNKKKEKNMQSEVATLPKYSN